MAVLKSAKCPNCGAVLSIDPYGEWAVCNFCGVRSSISRTRAIPAIRTPNSPPVLYVSTGGNAKWVLLLIAVAASVIVLAVFAVVSQNGTGFGLLNVALIGDPVLVDADQDGSDDVVIHGIVPGADTVHLRAYNGKNGKNLWVSAPLLKVGIGELVATVKGLVITASGGATVVGLDATTGKQRFQLSPPERVEAVCERDNEPLLLTKDNQLYAMNATTGALSPAGNVGHRQPNAPRPACAVARSDANGKFGSQSRTLHEYGLAKATNIRIDTVLDYQGKPPYLLVGRRPSGSGVPMIGARTDERVLWVSDVPNADPLKAVEGEPIAATIADGNVYAAYLRVDSPVVGVASFSLEDGSRRWEVQLPINDGGVMTVQLTASSEHVFVYTNKGNDGRLRSLNTKNGQLEWSVGG